MRKNILIITLKDAPNQGAFWQAFALKNFLNMNGFDVNFSNYISRSDDERDIYLKKTKEVIANAVESNLANDNGRVFQYDVAIIGSDEVWNLNNRIIQENDIFFGKGVNAKKIIAYAPCAVGAGFRRIFLKYGFIRKIECLSVRDKETYKLIRFGTGKKISKVLDPAFLIEYDKFLDKTKVNVFGNYVVVYSYGLNEEEKEIVLSYSKKNKCKIVFLGSRCEWADKNPIVDPFTWINYLYHAQFVFSSTFHGTVFSIIFNKQFGCLGNSCKMKLLLQEFGLEQHCFSNKDEFEKNKKNIVDYSKVNELVRKRMIESKRYLLESIG